MACCWTQTQREKAAKVLARMIMRSIAGYVGQLSEPKCVGKDLCLINFYNQPI
jgi:hypothetical protein